MIEHMNVINALSDQIKALLDLLQCTDGNADAESIRVAAEMCMTMQMEVEAECDKILNEWRDAVNERKEEH